MPVSTVKEKRKEREKAKGKAKAKRPAKRGYSSKSLVISAPSIMPKKTLNDISTSFCRRWLVKTS
jgi:hypothetical protein